MVEVIIGIAGLIIGFALGLWFCKRNPDIEKKIKDGVSQAMK
jgi:uncharacterized protein YneF (UPF0154 family)